MFKNYKKKGSLKQFPKLVSGSKPNKKGMVKYGYIPLLCIFYDKARGINIGYCWN